MSFYLQVLYAGIAISTLICVAVAAFTIYLNYIEESGLSEFTITAFPHNMDEDRTETTADAKLNIQAFHSDQ